MLLLWSITCIWCTEPSFILSNFTYQFHLVGTESWSQNASPFPPHIALGANNEIMDLSINTGKKKTSPTLQAEQNDWAIENRVCCKLQTLQCKQPTTAWWRYIDGRLVTRFTAHRQNVCPCTLPSFVCQPYPPALLLLHNSSKAEG